MTRRSIARVPLMKKREFGLALTTALMLLAGSVRGGSVTSNYWYRSTVSSDGGGALDLRAELNYDDTRSNAPIAVVMHGYSPVTGSLDTVRPHAQRLRENGFFAISVAMRGRDGADGVRDSGGLEIHDIYDAVEAVKADARFAGLIDPANVHITGYSGGGGNVMSALTKFPDTFRLGSAFFGMSDYGFDPVNGWYNNGAGTSHKAIMDADVGNPNTGGNPVRDKYHARASNLASKNNPYSEIHLFVNSNEPTCPPVNDTSYRDNAVAAASFGGEFDTITVHLGGAGAYVDFNTNSVNDPNELQDWPHTYPSANQQDAAELWYRDRLLADAIPQPALNDSDELFVAGYVKTRKFDLWLGDGQNAAAGLTYALSDEKMAFTLSIASSDAAVTGRLTVATATQWTNGEEITVTLNGSPVDSFVSGGSYTYDGLGHNDTLELVNEDYWGPFVGPWERYSGNPLLPKEGEPIDQGMCPGPDSIIPYNDKLLMFIYNQDGHNTKLAVSDDGLSWDYLNGGNPIFDADQAWEGTYALTKAVEVIDGTVHLYYMGKSGGSERIGIVTNDGPDLLTTGWTKHPENPLFGKEDLSIPATRVFPSCVVEDQGTYYSFFDVGGYSAYPGGHTINVASSTDGVHFAELATDIVTPGPAGSWNGTSVSHESVHKIGDWWFMIHSGYLGTKSTQAFGVARARNPQGPWEAYPGNPVFTPTGNAADWDGEFLQHPCPVQVNGEWWLYYSGNDLNPSKNTYRIGVAFLSSPASNQPPTVIGSPGVTMVKNTVHTFAAGEFNFDDVDGDSLGKVKVTSLETAGDLAYDGSDVTVPLEIDTANIGLLTFTPAVDTVGTPTYATFGFTVFDDAGTPLESAPATMNIEVLEMGTAVLHFDLDQTTGTTAPDASGRGNDGTLLTGGFAFDDDSVPGVFGNGLRFGATNTDRIEVQNNTGLPGPAGDFTVVFHLADDDWDGPNTFGVNEIIASYNLNGIQWNIALKAGKLVIGSSFGANNQGSWDVPGVVDGEFSHVGVVFTAVGGIGAVFVNGAPVAEVGPEENFLFGDAGIFTVSTRTRLGVNNSAVDGVLDDFAIYNSALSQAEVQSIMNNGVTPGSDGDEALLSITDAVMTSSGIVLHWSSVSNRVYSIWHTTNLAEGFTTELTSGLPATPAENVHTVVVDGVSSRFYRIGVE